MSDRVAIVEDTPPVRLPLVRCNHVSFDFAGPLHYCDDNFWLSLEQTGHLPLKIRKKPLIGDNAILDDLRQTGNPLTHRQSPKRQRINPYFLGLVERPDQILTKPMIDSCLSPDARIRLGDEGGWNLNKRDAALINRRRKSCHIADHASAKCQEKRRPLEPMTRHHIENMLDRIQCF